jgi:hypothetical protein
MKRLLLLAGLLAICGLSYGDPIATQSPVAVNDGPPSGYPMQIMIQRVPFGSGTPSVGVTDGYEAAPYVTSGLYHVPGYLPYGVEPEAVPPRVVTVNCHIGSFAGHTTWYCNGYSITPDLGRGENILIQPVFIK